MKFVNRYRRQIKNLDLRISHGDLNGNGRRHSSIIGKSGQFDEAEFLPCFDATRGTSAVQSRGGVSV